jgi:CheY-like chemotaxis protein
MYSGVRLNRSSINRETKGSKARDREFKGVACPNCGWSDLRVSQNAGFTDKVLSLFAFAPVRCRKCRLRFYRPWFMLNTSMAAPPIETRLQPLPGVEESILASPHKERVHEAPVLAPPTRDRAASFSVLLVDEDQAMRKLLAMLLNREGYAVHHAAHPDQAMDELGANRIDVVIANLSEEQQSPSIEKWRAAHPELQSVLMLPRLSRPHTVVQAVQTIVSTSRA